MNTEARRNMYNYYEKLQNQGYYIIAEVGVNYYEIAEMNGLSTIEGAKLMIKEAWKAGADAVKFQTYKAETLVREDSPGSWDRNDIPIETQYELFKLYDHFGVEEYRELAAYCSELDVEFMSTPFDSDSVDYLDEYMNIYKISSSDISNIPLMTQIAKKNKPIIMSVGASDVDEIDDAVKLIKRFNDKQLTILHCVLEYPTPYDHANLLKIRTLAERYPDAIIGYSDHTKPDDNMDVLKTAYLYGAKVIEKHFTLDKNIKKRNDHFHSMDTDDLAKAKNGIEFLKRISGSSDLRCLESEIPTRESVRRSAVALVDIMEGDVLSEDKIIFKRPGNGLSPKNTERIIGLKAKKDIKKDDVLKIEWFE